MLPFINCILAVQVTATVFAVLFNNFLIVIILKYSKSNIGFYKYLLIGFAAFEELYAVVVLIAMPLHLIAERSWLTFTYFGLLSLTPFPSLGPKLYCSFYQVWIVLVVINYLYRYIIVCRSSDFAITIANSKRVKAFLVFVICLVIIYCFVCGSFYCSQNHYSEKMRERLINEFNITDPETIGASMLRLTDNEGNISIFGLLATANHYILVAGSSIIITCCSFKIWRCITQMRKDLCQMKEASYQRQMFVSLMVQTFVPVVFCHIPTLICLSFPLLENFSFGPLSPIFTCLTSINKVIDPLITLFFIKDYRSATIKLLTGKDANSVYASTTAARTSRATSTVC